MAASNDLSGLIPYAINFSIVVGAFVFYGRRPLQKYVYQRRERLKDLVDAAVNAKKVAELRFVELQNQIQQLGQTEKKITQEYEQEARDLAVQIKNNLEYEIKRIEQETARIIANEEDGCVQKIKTEILLRSIHRAKQSLQNKMKKEDHASIIRSAKKQIEVEL